MTDKDKVYHYEKLLNMTMDNYKEIVKDAERILTYLPDNEYNGILTTRVRISAYNDIIKILTTILEMEDK